jgi:hypothetical protein
MTISQTIAAAPNVDADAPALEKGETEDRPNPVPKARRIRDRAAVTEAPAITADQETPDEWASLCSEPSG